MEAVRPEAIKASLLEVFAAFLKLGLTSFGGPIAHLGYFREEFVARRSWLSDHAYGDLVALCQFLPGPASSQVGMALGMSQRGLLGGLAAWLAFTLPSAIALVMFGLGVRMLAPGADAGWLHGLKVVAVAIVAQALWGMGRTLCPDARRATLAVLAAILSTAAPGPAGQVGSIILGGITGMALLEPAAALPHSSIQIGVSRSAGLLFLVLFFALLFGLPLAADWTARYEVQLVDSFYRAGALVFGGGHVVLPMLQSEVVPRGWVTNDVFLAGYGAAQAVPGPLFTFAAYLGAVSSQSPAGWVGAGIALLAIFLPAFLLVAGTLPFWERLRRDPRMQKAMLGINAAVVGLLLAAFYNPVWTSAIRSPTDFGLACACFLLLVAWKSPPWLVVGLSALASGLLANWVR